MPSSYDKTPLFSVRNIYVLKVSRQKGFAFHSKTPMESGFIYTVSGSMRYTFQGSGIMIDAPSGTMVYIPAETQYTSLYCGDDTHLEIVRFEHNNELPERLNEPSLICLDNAGELIDPFFTYSGEPYCAQIYYACRMYDLLWHIMTDDISAGTARKFRKLRPAIHELHKSFRENVPVIKYAELCHMSEAGFRRLFREYTGESPISYRNRLRLSEAKNLLASGEYLVSEVADSVGYENFSFFCRAYKRQFGCTPGK